MNLTITPKVTNTNYSQNLRNNNQTQSFGTLEPIVLRCPGERYDVLDRDKAVTVFMARMEDVASDRRINTDLLSDKGFAVEVTPKFKGSSKARVSLVDKTREVVTYGRARKPITVNISSAPIKERSYGVAIKAAEVFVGMLEKAGLTESAIKVRRADKGGRIGKLARSTAKLGKAFRK